MTRLINADGQDVTKTTLDAIHKAMGGGQGLEKAETISTANGIVAYDLEGPAKNLYPVLTPLRNRVARRTRGAGAGAAASWKEVTKIIGSGIPSMPWVPEGQRAARMSLETADRSASYVTIGEEADVTFEAQSAGEGFEDVMSTTGMRLLQATMIKEEFAILGGNRNVALGKPGAPVVTVATTGGSISAGSATKVRVRVVALTLEGFLASSLADGIKRQATITGMDGKTFTLNGGSSKASDPTASDISGTTAVVKATVAPVKGALAYAWFVELGDGTEALGNSHLEAITTINSVSLSALAGDKQALNETGMNLTVDYSRNADKAFDGLLYAAFNSSLAYHKALATGTAGTGTGLTASGRGSVDEIDEMLEAFWANYRISPEEIFVNAQELRNITTKTLTGSSSTPLVSFVQPNAGTPSVVAGQVVGYYFNPFSMNGGQMIPIKLHPNLPAGTLMAWAENLPAFYQSANVPETAVMQCRRDYYQIPWPLVTRANETGVYAEEVLKVQAPFAIGILTNIGDA